MSNLTKSERRWSALALIVTAQFMVILDVAIVNVALPSIQTDLNFSQANLQWVISAYAILFGARCSSVGGSPTCSAAGDCSWPVSLSSPQARCCAVSPGRRRR